MSDDSELPDEIASQLKLLTTHRRTLAHLLQEAAQFSPGFVPAHVANGISEARDNIARIKADLRKAGSPVEDRIGDTPSKHIPLRQTWMSRSIVLVLFILLILAYLFRQEQPNQLSNQDGTGISNLSASANPQIANTPIAMQNAPQTQIPQTSLSQSPAMLSTLTIPPPTISLSPTPLPPSPTLAPPTIIEQTRSIPTYTPTPLPSSCDLRPLEKEVRDLYNSENLENLIGCLILANPDRLASAITLDLGSIYYRRDDNDPRGDKFYIFYGSRAGDYAMIYTDKLPEDTAIDPSHKNSPGGNFRVVYEYCVDQPVTKLGVWKSDNITENLLGVYYRFEKGAMFFIRKKENRPPIVFVLYDSIIFAEESTKKCPTDKNPFERGKFIQYPISLS